ncbi:hypothetical protein [Leptospira sp. GIMC2001]|uniref:hypothetical protein n=1 Tax=Leptospira sp. GIMC2001 TaxID=1513297 RepID=UPI00234B2B17|nr:hypothetical protein [Leptospira sp. GIMC2001]WCL51028.1 hypothetical protein O4O04_09510 [Leptospira sp. GIMC2001]
MFTIFSILLGTFAVGLPAYVYYYNIKPSRKIAKILKNKFNEYYREFEKEQIDQAINNLSSSDFSLKSFSSTALLLRQTYDFSREQIFNIIDISQKESDFNIINSMEVILAAHPDPLVDNYFQNRFLNTNHINYAMKYFLFSGFDKFISVFLQKIISSPPEKNTFISVISSLKSLSENATIELFNNELFTEMINNEILLKNKSFIEKLFFESKSQNDYEKTSLFLKAKELQIDRNLNKEILESGIKKSEYDIQIKLKLEKYGLVRKNNLILDKDGNEQKRKIFAYGAFGPITVNEVIVIDGINIPIEEIPIDK